MYKRTEASDVTCHTHTYINGTVVVLCRRARPDRREHQHPHQIKIWSIGEPLLRCVPFMAIGDDAGRPAVYRSLPCAGTQLAGRRPNDSTSEKHTPAPSARSFPSGRSSQSQGSERPGRRRWRMMTDGRPLLSALLSVRYTSPSKQNETKRLDSQLKKH